jgi:hypothetical protein
LDGDVDGEGSELLGAVETGDNGAAGEAVLDEGGEKASGTEEPDCSEGLKNKVALSTN